VEEEGAARRNNSNNKPNQNQSGAIEPIVSVAINEYQNKTKSRWTLYMLVE
jgi:hypothetical protein